MTHPLHDLAPGAAPPDELNMSVLARAVRSCT
jgi:hypothetical protein